MFAFEDFLDGKYISAYIKFTGENEHPLIHEIALNIYNYPAS
jgi:hypothetical protein